MHHKKKRRRRAVSSVSSTHACRKLLPEQGALKLPVDESEICKRALPALSTSNDVQFHFSVPQVHGHGVAPLG